MSKKISIVSSAVLMGGLLLSACQTATLAPTAAAEVPVTKATVPAVEPTLAPGSVQLVARELLSRCRSMMCGQNPINSLTRL